MQRDAVSRTALGTTAGRALESRRPPADRLFEDPFAIRFLPASLRAIVRLLQVPMLGPVLLAMRERRAPGIMGNLLCRTRFIDDAVQDALSTDIQQVAILGAGFDSRAYRIAAMSGIRVFELDHPVTQAWKRERIKDMPEDVATHVTFVPIDFEREELGATITAAGFQVGAPSLFIWEGVTQYIGAAAVDSTLGWMPGAVGPGSRIVFTYVHRGLIDGYVQMEGMQRLLGELERQGEPWVFGIDPADIAQYLAARGFRLIQDVGASDYQTRYLEPIGRKMRIFEGERVVVAAVVGSGHLENSVEK